MSIQEQELLQTMMAEMTDIVLRCRKMYTTYSDYMMNAYKDNPTKRPTLLAKITSFESEADAICVTIKARRAYLSKSGKKKSDEVALESEISPTTVIEPMVSATLPAPSEVKCEVLCVEEQKQPKEKKEKKVKPIEEDTIQPPKKEKKSKKADNEPGQTALVTAVTPAITPEQAVTPQSITTAAIASVSATPQEDQKEEYQPIHQRRKKIPKHIKTLVWNQHIGNGISQGKCKCCMEEIINNRDFHCGHVVAESKGGDLTIPNLRPICAACNASMGTQSMNEFTKTFFGREI